MTWWRQTFSSKDRGWFWLVFLGWTSMAALAFFPASFWFEVERVHVFDTRDGRSPAMYVDRTIRRPFVARWLVTVMREGRDGFFSTYCPPAPGRNDYRPGSGLPDELDLEWWIAPAKCALIPGRYQVRTVWTMEFPGIMPEKQVRATSNIFTVN